MADVARCRCPIDSAGTKCGVNPACPIHGYSAPNPLKPYVLSQADRDLLKSMRIAITTTDDIEETRKADENRWKERN